MKSQSTLSAKREQATRIAQLLEERARKSGGLGTRRAWLRVAKFLMADPHYRSDGTVNCEVCGAAAPIDAFRPFRSQFLAWGACRTCRSARSKAERTRRPPISRRVRRQVWEFCEGLCTYCDAVLPVNSSWHVDHVLSLRLGGGNEIENLVASCALCNAGPLSLWTFRGDDLRIVYGRRAWYREAIEAIQILDGTTVWEKRAFVQQIKARELGIASGANESIARRVSHLAPERRACPPVS